MLYTNVKFGQFINHINIHVILIPLVSLANLKKKVNFSQGPKKYVRLLFDENLKQGR